jgi:Zn-dependent protease
MSLDPASLALLIPVILLALSFHEMAHAWTASRLGDHTARDLGRVSLDPRRHLDPLGTLMVFLAGFGWAKPVPVDPRNLQNPHRDSLWIAAAGPVSNLLLAAASGLLLQLVVRSGLAGALPGVAGEGALRLLALSVHLNLALMAFNLIPLPPLDGAQVLKGLLSPTAAAQLARLDPIGPFLLLGLILMGRATGSSVIGMLINPVIGALSQVVTGGLL